MRGGGKGEMLTLNQDDITALKACEDIPKYIKTNITAGMGLEHIPETNVFKIHTQTRTTMQISQKENRDTYKTALNIYNSGRQLDQVKPEIIYTVNRPYRGSDRGFDEGR